MQTDFHAPPVQIALPMQNYQLKESNEGELQFKQLQKRSLGKKIKASTGIEPMPPRY